MMATLAHNKDHALSSCAATFKLAVTRSAVSLFTTTQLLKALLNYLAVRFSFTNLVL